MFKFKPEDFNGFHSADPRMNATGVMAGIANSILAKEIETWPVVYSNEKDINNNWQFHKDSLARDTHKARLAFIEPIVKKECKHVPVEYNINEIGTCQLSICKYCRIELIAEWKAK